MTKFKIITLVGLLLTAGLIVFAIVGFKGKDEVPNFINPLTANNYLKIENFDNFEADITSTENNEGEIKVKKMNYKTDKLLSKSTGFHILEAWPYVGSGFDEAVSYRVMENRKQIITNSYPQENAYITSQEEGDNFYFTNSKKEPTNFNFSKVQAHTGRYMIPTFSKLEMDVKSYEKKGDFYSYTSCKNNGFKSLFWLMWWYKDVELSAFEIIDFRVKFKEEKVDQVIFEYKTNPQVANLYIKLDIKFKNYGTTKVEIPDSMKSRVDHSIAIKEKTSQKVYDFSFPDDIVLGGNTKLEVGKSIVDKFFPMNNYHWYNFTAPKDGVYSFIIESANKFNIEVFKGEKPKRDNLEKWLKENKVLDKTTEEFKEVILKQNMKKGETYSFKIMRISLKNEGYNFEVVLENIEP